MKGSMMDYPLNLQAILERIPKTYPTVEIVSRLPDGGLHRYTYLNFYRRTRSLAEALHRAGLQPGDRVGTLCWNHYAHLEAYFGVPAAGGVVHTLNLRLHPQELAFIVNHAQDRFLIVDDVLLPLFAQFRDKVKPERVFVVRHENQALPSGMEGYEEYSHFAPILQEYCSYAARVAPRDDALMLTKNEGVLDAHDLLGTCDLGLGGTAPSPGRSL